MELILQNGSLFLKEKKKEQQYSNILEVLLRSDSRYPLVISVMGWLLHRRRRIDQQLQRRRNFNRRMLRLMYLRSQLQRNTLIGISCTLRATEEALSQNLHSFPEKRIWVKHNKTSKDFWNQFENNELSPKSFLQHFHMTEDTFNFIYQKLEEHLRKSNTCMRECLPAKKRLAATLYRLATNSEYLKVANLFGIGKSTTSSLVRDVCEVIVAILKEEFLHLNMETKSISETAIDKFEIPQVIGSIGAIDVFILGSFCDWEEPSPYLSNYSCSPALIFQAVVNHFGHFIYVSAGRPAAMSNLKALQKSSLPLRIQEIYSTCGRETVNRSNIPPLVAGDESYAGYFPWILNPLQEHEIGAGLHQQGQVLNDKIQKALAKFEEAIVKVKSRWKIFHGKNGKINFNADAFENIAIACCILHNICEIKKDPIDPSWMSDISLFVRRGLSHPAEADNATAAGDRDDDKSMGNDTLLDDNDGQKCPHMQGMPSQSDIKMALLQSTDV